MDLLNRSAKKKKLGDLEIPKVEKLMKADKPDKP